MPRPWGVHCLSENWVQQSLSGGSPGGEHSAQGGKSCLWRSRTAKAAEGQGVGCGVRRGKGHHRKNSDPISEYRRGLFPFWGDVLGVFCGYSENLWLDFRQARIIAVFLLIWGAEDRAVIAYAKVPHDAKNTRLRNGKEYIYSSLRFWCTSNIRKRHIANMLFW